ncbi:MAG: 5'-nucleotidase, lipoprotein e(P4) family [Dysgonamonadaceae bacterium]
MKQKELLLFAALALSVTACRTGKTTLPRQEAAPYADVQQKGKLYASFFQQRAAEYEALSQQAFNIARIRLDEAIAHKGDKPLAIVSDIDETFLDNSYYAVDCVKKGISYDQKSWEEWTAKGIATPLTGAQEFYQYADSKGVAVFYITNRLTAERAGTLANLKKYNFPLQNEGRLILRSAESSKENRRLQVSKDFDIVLLLGDNLSDFSKDFDKKSMAERAAAVHANKELFGTRFIVLPNFGYGDWEGAAFNYNYSLPEIQKDSIIWKLSKRSPEE